jgi:hypothetical protein
MELFLKSSSNRRYSRYSWEQQTTIPVAVTLPALFALSTRTHPFE